MIRSAVTVSLVAEARGGPFVFWHDLAGACAEAGGLGFDAIELFAPSADAVDRQQLRRLLDQHSLNLAAVGTGAGWLIHRLALTDPDPAIRQGAVRFIERLIELGAAFGAPAIIGSMQGRSQLCGDHARAMEWLGDGLVQLGAFAAERGVPLLYEPLNRYETDLCRTQAEGVAMIESRGLKNVKLLADLFHMNIEEADLAAALRSAAGHVGHVHFVDTNRRAAGMGHLDYRPIAQALQAIGYSGYASAEALPLPDPLSAARATIGAYRRVFGIQEVLRHD